MRGERGEIWRLLVCTSSDVSICVCVSVLQDFDAMTEEEQMAFAIQMSLGKQQGVCIFRICLSYTSVHIILYVYVHVHKLFYCDNVLCVGARSV